MLSLPRLEQLLAAFPRLTIGLVGDLFLDRYLEIEPGVREMSIETGLEAYQVSRVRNSPGALGTVMNNLAALGVGLLAPVTVLGDDGHAYDLLHELRKLPVDTRHVVKDPHRLTPTYTKPMKQDEADGTKGGPTTMEGRNADGTRSVPATLWRELNRLDVRTRGPLAEKTSERVCEELRHVFHSSDGLIVLDQINETNWGVVNERVRTCLADLAEVSPDKLIYIDSRAHLGCFTRGVLKGNRAELARAAKQLSANSSFLNAEPCPLNPEPLLAEPYPLNPDLSPLNTEPSSLLSARTGKPVYCTQGEEGILVAQPGQTPVLVPGVPVAGPIDIVGAGDSATSGMVAALLAGADWLEAAAVGNLVASITVQQLGTTGTATREQVVERWKEAQSSRAIK